MLAKLLEESVLPSLDIFQSLWDSRQPGVAKEHLGDPARLELKYRALRSSSGQVAHGGQSGVDTPSRPDVHVQLQVRKIVYTQGMMEVP